MFLVLLVLSVFSGLGREYSRILRFSDAKGASLQAAVTGLEGVSRELRGAFSIQQPNAAGNSDTTLKFRVVDPNQTARLYPNPAPSRSPTRNLNAATFHQTIEYSCRAGGLQRIVLNASNAEISRQQLAAEVTGFKATWNTDGTMRIELTVQEEKKLRTLAQTVLLRAGL